MKPYTCADVDRSLWLYIDRELSASELAKISSHLRDCAPCSALYHDRAREARQYRMAFSETPFGDKFAGRLRQKMVEEGHYGGMEHLPAAHAERPGAASRDRSSSTRSWGLFWLHRGRRRRLVTVATMLCLIPIIVVIGVLSNGPSSENLGWLSVEQGKVSVRFIPGSPAAGKPRADSGHGEAPADTLVTRDTAICPGLVCTVSEGGIAKLRLLPGDGGSSREESWAQVKGPAEFRVSPQASRKRFTGRLEAGRFDTHVAPRLAGELFQIDTPHSHVTVVGTRFELMVRARETSLLVREGKVRFEHANAQLGQGVEIVSPDSGLYIARDGETRPVADSASISAAAPEPHAPEPVSAKPSAEEPPVKPSVSPARPEPADPSRTGADLDQPVNGDAK